MITLKITDTVERLANLYPALEKRYNDILLACAYELADSVSMRLVRAHQVMLKVDPDNEADWHAAADEVNAAESAFLDAHSGTVVTL